MDQIFNTVFFSPSTVHNWDMQGYNHGSYVARYAVKKDMDFIWRAG